MTSALAISAVVAILWGLVAWGRSATRRQLEAKRAGTYARNFVLVEDDGTARDLTAEEMAYLNTEFDPADGARPYIKMRYGSRTPDGLLGGFLLKRKLPARVVPRKVARRLTRRGRADAR